MAKKDIKKFLPNGKLNPEFLEQLKRSTLIQSTASSLRLAGINVSNEEVAQTMESLVTATVSNKNIEKMLSPNQLVVWRYLQSVDEATPGQIAKEANVARPTVNQVLVKLLRLKKIEKIGFGRATRYRKL